jgi:type I restriction enzyme S subunit
MKWEKVKIGELFQIKHGWAFKGEYFSNEGELIIVTPGNFYEGGGFRQVGGKEKFYTGDFPQEFLLKKNDVIIAMTEQGPGLLGSPALVPADEKYLHNQRIGLINEIDNTRIDKEFIYRLFYTAIVRNEIFGSATGTKVKHTAPKRIYSIEVEIPPLPTQRKIASILSAYDDLIENNLKRIKLLEEKAFLRYKSEFDFFKPSNEINKLPEGWFVKRADEIFKINIGKTPPREQSEWFNDEDSKVKWVSIKDINNSTVFAFETSETVTEMAARKFNMNVAKEHTVLLSFKLTVGKVAITTENMTTNEAIAHFNIEDESQMCSEYIYFYLKNFPYDSLGSTSSIGTAINSKVVKAMPVLLPPSKVINDYKKDVGNDFNLVQNLLKQNTKLREARDILLPRLMNGEIEV